MSVLIRVLGTGREDFVQPCFLKSYDPEAHGGRGVTEFTMHEDEAIHFENAADALNTYRSVPVSLPFREDGEPNRPLTTFTVEIGPT